MQTTGRPRTIPASRRPYWCTERIGIFLPVHNLHSRTPVCGTRKIGIWLFLASEVMLFGDYSQPIFLATDRATGRMAARLLNVPVGR